MRIIFYLLTIFCSYVSIAFAHPVIQINIPAYTLEVVEDGQVIKKYSIAVGTPYEQTPTGTFEIFYKEKDPTWYPGANFTDRTPVYPGQENPLGSRWMEFTPNYGIHGTNKNWDIEYPVSGGCIRMHDKDAQELYERVDIGTPVIITYNTLMLIEKADGLYVKLLPDIYGRDTNSREQFLSQIAVYLPRYVVREGALLPKMEFNTVYEAKVGMRKKI